jgi:Protein of unknown function (DUF1552)
MMKTLNRRTLLRGAGGAAIALPFLSAMGDPKKRFGFKTAHAATGFPKRLLIVNTGNGSVNGYNPTTKGVGGAGAIGTNRWSPTGTPTAFDLSNPANILAPLTPNAKNLLLLDGFDNRAGGDADGICFGNPHNKLATQLTVRKYEQSTKMLYNDAGGGTSKCGVYLTAGGISVDQELSNRLMGMAKFPNIMMFTGPNPKTLYAKEGFVNSGLGTMKLYLSWKGKDQAVIGEFDPTKSFSTIFGGGVAPGTPIDNTAQLARDKSILDAALESYTGLSARVGHDDKIRLDAHAESIRAIEAQLSGMQSMPATLSCKAPTAPGATDLTAFANYPATLNVQSDLMVAAMACDLTRVGVLEWEPGFSEIVHTWLGINKEHHGISHDTSAGAIENLVKINNYYAKEFNNLIEKFKAIPEGNGTMLDNTAILWMRELGEGSSHDTFNQNWIIAGTGGGYFKNNFWFKPTGNDKSYYGNLILHFLHMFGFTDTTFGDPAYCNGLMTSITA